MPRRIDQSESAPPFAVRTAGHVSGQPHHSTPGSKQRDVMLTVFTAGRGHYYRSGQRIGIGPGFVGLVPDDDPGILMAEAADPYDHYYCRFGGGYALHLAAEAVAARGARFFRHERVEEMADAVRRMGRLHRVELPAAMGEPEVLLAGALVLLTSPAGAPRGRQLSRSSFEHYLHDHVSEPFRLDAVAEHFGVSRTSLCRAVRRLTGRTAQYLAEEIKMEWAGTLLASGVANVSEAALRVGYEDPFYFSRVFRRRTGLAPRDWAAGRRPPKTPFA
jgi:AraC-like DNA-binding protein